MQSLISEEVLHSLYFARPVTKGTLATVQDYMKALLPAHRVNFTIPLAFVDVKMGKELFSRQLEMTSLMTLKRQENIFYEVKPTTGLLLVVYRFYSVVDTET